MMGRKKVDSRLRLLIENGVATGHRTMFVIVGDNCRDQVVILHHLLSKSSVRSHPSVLWCYKRELGFSSHRKKRMRQLQKKIKHGTLNVDDNDDPFELFITATNIRYCHYSDTYKILGNTFGMCVLQDFEALTPNLLARTIETVEGGGVIAIMLKSLTSLKQVYTMAMDVHARYRTESHMDVVGHFNERFVLSLATCENCIVIDHQLKILPISAHSLNIKPRVSNADKESDEFRALKESVKVLSTSNLVNCCKTLDQAKVLLKFIEAITEKKLISTVSVTAARGRGKSAALGLAIASAVEFRYTNIFVTSPSPENLNTIFEFVFKGFDALDYQEQVDYEIVHSTNPDFNKAIVRVNIFKNHRQAIQYIHPTDASQLSQAELVVIDEAAAIPLPLVKRLLGPYLVFMTSTINGYEGTGRSLSLKLLQQLRQQAVSSVNVKSSTRPRTLATDRMLHEVSLNESIRYCPNDPVEQWLNMLLCLDATVLPTTTSKCPIPDDCDLYYINKDTLFSYHEASEVFLQQLMALYVASHYKNSPNDLQMLSDAPAHHLFCLIGPVDFTKTKLPEILCVIQVCLEGNLSQASVVSGLMRGQRASGDMIPWTLAQQFPDQQFPSLSGARIVRIASHPDCQRMGYGTRALHLIQKYYSGLIPCTDEVLNEFQAQEIQSFEEIDILEEQVLPREKLSPLLLKLSERPAEHVDYIGVSFGLTADLLRFWKRSGFVPVYVRQTPNDLTGEHSCIMLKILHKDEESTKAEWLMNFWLEFRSEFISLLGFEFRTFHPSLVLNVLQNKTCSMLPTTMTKEEFHYNFTDHKFKKLELYTKNMADYHLVVSLLPRIAELYFQQKLGSCKFTAVQSAMLAGMGLQKKSVDAIAKELQQPANQLLGLFNKTLRQIVQHLSSIDKNSISEFVIAKPIKTNFEEDEGAKKQLKYLSMTQNCTKEIADDGQLTLSESSNDNTSVKGVTSKRKLVHDEVNELLVQDNLKRKKKSHTFENY